MREYLRALKWGLFGATAGPLVFITAGYLLAAMGMGAALVCVVVFPLMAIFYPHKLLEFVKPTKEDREIARRIDERLRR